MFLEEAQWLEEAGLFIKGLVDHRRGWTLFVTGSSSFHLMSRTRESLAGRATRHHVWPLTLDEATHAHRDALPGVRREVRRAALDRLMVWGGYPGVWTAEEPEEVLHELVTAFVLRDASDRFRIERPDALRLILRLAAAQAGDLVRTSEWASLAGVSSPTVSQYVSLLEETHALATIRPFVGGRRAELTRAPKVYFIDGGLRNAVRGGFAPLDERPDVGQLMEGWVFSELHKRFPEPGDVRYWRTKSGAEVDFVVRTRSDRPVGVEVKARRAAGRFKLSRSARSFIGAYRPSDFLLVHRGEAHEETVADTRVRWVPAEELPEVLDDLAVGVPV
ncbi:MAG: ATP-binding protein [Myxococcota bacterium]